MSFAPEHFAVWTEIPVTDMDRAVKFYNEVFDFDLKIDESGPNPMAMMPTSPEGGVSCHLYPGKPAKDGNGPTIHFLCSASLEETIVRVKKAGGKVLSDIITIPPGRFAYCLDPDGNSIGVFKG